jgi:hypothetical protein
MRIVTFAWNEQLVKKLLEHLVLLSAKRKPLLLSNVPKSKTIIVYKLMLIDWYRRFAIGDCGADEFLD